MHHPDFSSQIARIEILARLERAREFRAGGLSRRPRYRGAMLRPPLR